MVETNNPDTVEWLADRLESDPSLLTGHKNKARVREFRDRLAAALESETDENGRSRLERIAKAVRSGRRDAKGKS